MRPYQRSDHRQILEEEREDAAALVNYRSWERIKRHVLADAWMSERGAVITEVGGFEVWADERGVRVKAPTSAHWTRNIEELDWHNLWWLVRSNPSRSEEAWQDWLLQLEWEPMFPLRHPLILLGEAA